MKRFVAILSGILLAAAAVMFSVYHLINMLPSGRMSYNTQAAAILENAACGKCHDSNNEIFDIHETVGKLKNDTAANETALAKIEYVTVMNRLMPPKTYCLTHWGTAINSAERKLLREWINYQRDNYYSSTAVFEPFRHEPLRPLREPESADDKKTELGRKLYFDKRLSADNSVSCNTCHNLAANGADNRQYSRGAGKILAEINTPTVFNACLSFRQFWDGRAADLHAQLHEHLFDPAIMRNHSFEEIIKKLAGDKNLKNDFLKIYHGGGITPESIVETIVAFERTLVTPNSRFDKYLKGSLQLLSEAEIVGYELFKANKCATCHAGMMLGGQSIEKLGIHGDYYKDRGWPANKKDKAGFKTPGLRNVARTKPYFHDGSRQTLHDAVKSMGKYQAGTKLSDRDTKAIVLFLNTLSE
jgi:cytochrome c peroxidase